MSNVATKAKKPNLSVKSVLNWILDHAMIIVIVLLALYVQTQRDAFLKPASLINIISLTAARLPMALGVAGCIILAGTDLTGGRVAGLTAFVAAILLHPKIQDIVVVGIKDSIRDEAIKAFIVLNEGETLSEAEFFSFCENNMAKFKVPPYIITLAMQMIVYGIYLTVSNSVQVGSFDSSYTTSFVTKPLFQIQTGVRPNGTAIFTVVPMYVLLALIVTALMWVVWNKTAFGKNMFAVGSNEEAARVSGVNVMMTIIGVFMVAGALYGYTGFIEAARMGSSTATLGLNYEADAISAAVIGGVSFVGGTGRISGVVLGVFMMQLIIAGMTFLGISGNVTYIVKGAVILFAVILDMRKYMTRK